MPNEKPVFPLTDEEVTGRNWRPIRDGDFVWHVPEEAASADDIKLGIVKFGDSPVVYYLDGPVVGSASLNRLSLAENRDADRSVFTPAETEWWWHILYKTRDGWKVLCDGDNEPLNIGIDERDSRAAAMADSGLYLGVRTVRGAWIVNLDPEVPGGE